MSSNGHHHLLIFVISDKQQIRNVRIGQRLLDGQEPEGNVFPKYLQGALLSRPMTTTCGKVDDFKERKQHSRKLTPEEMVAKQLKLQLRNHGTNQSRLMKSLTTQRQLPHSNLLSLRLQTTHFSTNFYPFNKAHVTLVDTAPRGVEEINERGVVHQGTEYPLDVLIYATGLQWMATSTFNMVQGREVESLMKWQQEGTKTFLGLHSQGFPESIHYHGAAGRRR